MLVLAHGAGAPMDSGFMTELAVALAGEGLRVLRFEFPYMAKRRATGARGAPDREAVLLASWRQAIEAAGGGSKVAIGGKSMGGRMASLVADEAGVRGMVCFGFPFHAPGRDPGGRIAHLEALRTPALIVQGTRDPFGGTADVAGYALGDSIAVHWLDDGDHDFKPRRPSGHTQAGHIGAAAKAAAAFVAGLPAMGERSP